MRVFSRCFGSSAGVMSRRSRSRFLIDRDDGRFESTVSRGDLNRVVQKRNDALLLLLRCEKLAIATARQKRSFSTVSADIWQRERGCLAREYSSTTGPNGVRLCSSVTPFVRSFVRCCDSRKLRARSAIGNQRLVKQRATALYGPVKFSRLTRRRSLRE